MSCVEVNVIDRRNSLCGYEAGHFPTLADAAVLIMPRGINTLSGYFNDRRCNFFMDRRLSATKRTAACSGPKARGNPRRSEGCGIKLRLRASPGTPNLGFRN